MPKKKKRVPKEMVRGWTVRYPVDLNKREMLEIEDLSREIFNKISDKIGIPDMYDTEETEDCVHEYPAYLYNGLKITIRDDRYYVLHTYTEPYIRVLDRWFLRLILENI
jgi:hypothetical protein